MNYQPYTARSEGGQGYIDGPSSMIEAIRNPEYLAAKLNQAYVAGYHHAAKDARAAIAALLAPEGGKFP